ncbi:MULTISPECIES: mechanosensitive ion channel domain-containing protein [unclassified Microbacterium]|uniref:mechanosensitive ion channel family protein n=1 Tax=unclassified Microbacterium TaxID=2609290 RepID=UPI001D8D7DE2|nr:MULTISPECIES: mechanosensitive ion channel domain-containing protein [unclassified Microbacterium]CAH0123263.1 Miniconductance mechanosensitive channel MscM [Microbacterium sp. Bi121]HWK76684.1 mechanosensitive ion channel domain-containing protein [Microbacterium sp.]
MASLAEFTLEWTSWIGTLIATVVAVVIVSVIVTGVRFVAGRARGRSAWIADLERRIRVPGMTLAFVIAAWIVCATTAPASLSWWPVLDRLLLIATVLVGAWLLSTLVTFGMERLMQYDSRKDATSPEARRRQTQLTVLNRLAVVLVGVIAVGVVLFSFPEVRAVGTSILASAGVVSIIAGLAAQSTLGNLIAGVQIAFTDAIRVGDVVVIEGEWGRIGEINLSYVVVYIWDERRLILPCTYFTSQPVESWTRRSDKILGTVYMDLDWRVPVDAVREKFMEIIEGSDAWDRRSAGMVVTGSEGGHVTLRFTVSSANSGDQWDLRCLVREKVMIWLQQEHPEALPVTRVMLDRPA